MFGRGHTRNTIPPLVSGGVMLSYHCTNTCRHCLYRCSPKRPSEWMTMETAERVFTALSKEPQLQGIHLAGGEATTQFELLCDIIRLAGDHRIPLDYLETNAAWCADRRETRDRLFALREAGLPAILVSASMFHNEFVPFDYTRNCVEAGWEVFGRRGVIVWVPHLYETLASLPNPEKTRSLKEFCKLVGISEWSEQLPASYHLIPGGRAPQALRKCYECLPVEAYRGQSCPSELYGTSHFHIDHHGHLFTGCCAGIVAGTAENLHPDIDEEAFPIFSALVSGGPVKLMDLAPDFAPREDGYPGKCGLCFAVRKHLSKHGDYHELRPVDYYTCA